MLVLLAGFAALAYACVDPAPLARLGFRARVRRWRVAESLLARLYRLTSGVHTLVFGRPPASRYDRLMQFAWRPHDDAVAAFRQYIDARLGTPVTLAAEETRFAAIRDRAGVAAATYQTVGFQGGDPSTDIRGSGLLGLDLLHALSARRDVYTRLLAESRTDSDFSQPCYPLALAAIRVARTLAVELLAHDVVLFELQSAAFDDDLARLSFVHVALLQQFHALWAQEVAAGRVRSIMDVEAVFAEFERGFAEKVHAVVANHKPDAAS